jgi:quercetin dioxygenase-like cupin family protein
VTATGEEKMNLTTKIVAATSIALPALLVPVMAQQITDYATVQGIKRTALRTFGFPPGYQTVMALAEIDPGVCIGRHTHPGIENAHVLEGEIGLKVEGKPDQLFKAGDSLQVPAGVPHDACTTTSAYKVLTVHIVEKGKPLTSPDNR